MNILGTSEDIKTSILKYKQVLKENKATLQAKQESILSIFDNAKEDFDNNKIESAVADAKKVISYQKNWESAIKPNIDDYIKQENYKRKHKFTTWLKTCMVKPYPTFPDDFGERASIVFGMGLGWSFRIIAFCLDESLFSIIGTIIGICLGIPSVVKFFCKNGSKFGVFNFLAEIIMLIGSIIWFSLR